MSHLNPNIAMVVLSGGQDSTTCLYWALAQGFHEVHAITFDYGQRHRRELQAAVSIATIAGIGPRHKVVNVAGLLLGTSPLVSQESLETYSSAEEMAAIIGDRVEKTFVPMRNTLFLTVAANHAIAVNAGTLVTGICQEDNANYPDCTEQFREVIELSFNQSLGLVADEPGSLRILAPLMDLSKAQTVKLALTLPGCLEGLAYSHTAYSGEYPPLTQDHATVLRAHGFLEAGVPDPLIVRAWREGKMQLPTTQNYQRLIDGDEPQVVYTDLAAQAVEELKAV